MCQLLRNIESYQLGQKIGIEVFDLVVSKIAELDYPPVHYAFKNIVKQRLENEPSIQVINSCKKHLKGTSVYRCITQLCVMFPLLN